MFSGGWLLRFSTLGCLSSEGALIAVRIFAAMLPHTHTARIRELNNRQAASVISHPAAQEGPLLSKVRFGAISNSSSMHISKAKMTKPLGKENNTRLGRILRRMLVGNALPAPGALRRQVE